MKTTKIVFIGAGSMSFGLSMYRDLFTSHELEGSTLTLVDLNANNLQRMYDLALKMNEVSGCGLCIEKTANRKTALVGANFVVNSVAIDRNRLWKQDFLVPKKYGIRHTLGENGGPGGLFFTMRTLPLILEIARDMEELCPDAYLLNFSNPESRIVLALGRYTKIKSMGLCHGLWQSKEHISTILNCNPEDFEVLAAGLNHFQWILKLWDPRTRVDYYALLREKERTYPDSYVPLTRKLFRAFGYWPTCSDDHLGEYLPYGWEAGEHGYDFEKDEQYRVELQNQVIAGVSGKKDVKEWLRPSGERAVALITGVLHNKKTLVESAIVYNQGCITNLHPDAAVEVPVIADASGVHPVHIGDLPSQIARILTPQVCVQQMAVDAAVTGSREMALQALLIDPVVNSVTAAEKLLDDLWELNKPYIKACIPPAA